MEQKILTIAKNEKIAEKTYLLRLEGDCRAITTPGQFADIRLASKFLRRPLSVCDFDCEGFTVAYQVAGSGTEIMSALPVGEKLDVLLGLGNGFNMDESGEKPLLIGGGTGASPLFGLAKRLVAQGKSVSVILGFGSGGQAILADAFESLGCKVTVTTADGSMGKKGFVTDAMGEFDQSYVYACGPIAMLKAVDASCKTGGEFSLEARMGCGFGACMGCSIMTKSGSRRVCREGPVFKREELIW